MEESKLYRCAICERRIRQDYGVCIECEQLHALKGVPRPKWPQDILELIAEQRRYDGDPLLDPETISLDALLEAGFQVDTDGNLYQPEDWICELRDEDLFRVAPYPTYAENAQYWRANNIKLEPDSREAVRAALPRKRICREVYKLEKATERVLGQAYERAHRTKRIGPLDNDHCQWRDWKWQSPRPR